MKVWGYCRVSTVRQAEEGLSLEAQEKAIRHYCDYRGIELAGVLVERGVSAEVKLHLRPEGAKLFALPPDVTGIVGAKLDRLFRNAADCLDSVQGWQEAGVSLHLLDLNLDTSTPMGKAFLTMAAAFAELEKARIKERVVSGIAEAKARGVKMGRPWQALDPDVEGEILTLHAMGKSGREIARILNERGVRANGGGAWQSRNIGKVING